MTAIGAHLSQFLQNETRSVLEWGSLVAKWLGFEIFGSALERADQGLHMADAVAGTIRLYDAATVVTDLTSAGRALAKGGGLIGDVVSTIDFLSYIRVVAVESELLSRISLIGNVASLIKSAYKVANQAGKIIRFAASEGAVSELCAVRQSIKLVRTVTKIAMAVLSIAVFVGVMTVSPLVLLGLSSGVLILTTASYVLKKEVGRLENR